MKCRLEVYVMMRDGEWGLKGMRGEGVGGEEGGTKCLSVNLYCNNCLRSLFLLFWRLKQLQKVGMYQLRSLCIYIKYFLF